MTTSVEVKARAHGARVTVITEGGEDQSFDVAPNSSQEFHIDDSQSVGVVQGEAPDPAEANPNDALIKPVDPATLDELSGNTTRPVGNMTGGMETAQTTDSNSKPKVR